MKAGRRDGRRNGQHDRGLLETPPQFEGNYDPHVWFDVTMWMKAVETVRDTLVTIDPANADDYRANTVAYLTELTALNEYVKSKANLLPEDKRVLITAHDAFSYFGRRYGFEVRGLQGISTVSEAGTDVQSSRVHSQRKIPRIRRVFVLRNLSKPSRLRSRRGIDVVGVAVL
jgi:manganese/zinc/iron transport system substrate-binding protein